MELSKEAMQHIVNDKGIDLIGPLIQLNDEMKDWTPDRWWHNKLAWGGKLVGCGDCEGRVIDMSGAGGEVSGLIKVLGENCKVLGEVDHPVDIVEDDTCVAGYVPNSKPNMVYRLGAETGGRFGDEEFGERLRERNTEMLRLRDFPDS